MPPRNWLLAVALVAAVAAVAAVVLAFTLLEVGVEQGARLIGVVRVGTLRGGLSSLDVILELGLDERHGFRVEPLLFTSTLDLANALARGDVDVAIIPAEFVAKLRERGVNVTVLAVDFYQNQAVVVRSDVEAETLTDLRGARIGVFKPTGTFAMFRAYARLVYNVSDVEEFFRLVNAPPPQLVQAFERGDVDAVVIWEPFVSKLVAEAGGRILVDYAAMWRAWRGHVGGNGVMIVYAARADWAYANPGLVEALLAARSEAARAWNGNGTLVVTLLARVYGLSEEAARLCWERVRMEESPTLTGQLVENILAVWRLAREGGYITADPGELAGPGAFWAGS